MLNNPERYVQRNIWPPCKQCPLDETLLKGEISPEFRQQDNTSLAACKDVKVEFAQPWRSRLCVNPRAVGVSEAPACSLRSTRFLQENCNWQGSCYTDGNKGPRCATSLLVPQLAKWSILQPRFFRSDEVVSLLSDIRQVPMRDGAGEPPS